MLKMQNKTNTIVHTNNHKNLPIQDRRYRTVDFQETRFFQMPKSLFGNPRYQGLELGAKAMYAILRDRQDLSIQNGWTDKEGFIYSLYSIDELANLIEINRKTVMRYKKMLIEYGLLVAKSPGNGLADYLYILKPEIGDEYTSPKNGPVQKMDLGPVQKMDPNDTDLSDTKDDDDKCSYKKEILHCEKMKVGGTEMGMERYQQINMSLVQQKAQQEKKLIKERNKGSNSLQERRTLQMEFATLLDEKEFTEVMERVEKADPTDLLAYARKSLLTAVHRKNEHELIHSEKMAQEAARIAQNGEKSKKAMHTFQKKKRKTTIPVIQPQKIPSNSLSPEEYQRAKELAKKLDVEREYVSTL